jgi:hypothetical protein
MREASEQAQQEVEEQARREAEYEQARKEKAEWVRGEVVRLEAEAQARGGAAQLARSTAKQGALKKK